jgi:hypothetical protein
LCAGAGAARSAPQHLPTQAPAQFQGTLSGTPKPGAVETSCVISEINEGVFPILKCIDEQAWEFIGTGFFIAANGLFATAKHVLLEAYDYENNKLGHLFLVHWLPNGKFLMRQVRMAAVHPVIDVGVGILYPLKHFITDERLTTAQLCLTAEQPRQNEPIFTYAYPKTIVQNTQISSVYLYPGYYIGRLEEYYENGRDQLLPYPCYRTSITIHGGASGGPVIDSYGRVFAINSKSFNTEDGNPNISFVSRITDMLSIPPLYVQAGTRSRVPMTIRDLARPGYLHFEPPLP